jgi:integrase
LLGPEAIAAVLPWLRLDDPDSPIFGPRRASERAAKKGGDRAPGVYYNRHSLARAVRRAARRAGVSPWSLAQLRHSAATRIRERFGVDVAAVVLGHADPKMTSRYSKEAIAHAIGAVREVG